MLAGKGDTDNRNKQKYTETNMHQCCVQATAKQPDNIAKHIETTRAAGITNYLPAERPQNQTCYFKTL